MTFPRHTICWQEWHSDDFLTQRINIHPVPPRAHQKKLLHEAAKSARNAFKSRPHPK